MTDRPLEAAEPARRPAGTESGDGAREVVASFTAYADAVRAVDTLSDRGFPVEHARIVAHDLRFVEQVTGRETTGRAVARAALSGFLFGAVFGLLFGLMAWRDPVASGLILALYGAILGAVVGAIVGAVGHRSAGGRRDFSSVAAMQAGGYDVMVDQAHCEEARRALAEIPPTG
jgi:hypothetical protein